jgi:hypothetical protein
LAFGARWADAAPILAMLGVWGMIRVVNVWLGWVLALEDRQRLAGIAAVAWFPVFLGGVIAGAELDGGFGAAIAVTVQMAAHTATLVVLAARHSPISLGATSRRLAPFLCAWVAAIAAALLAARLVESAPPAVDLAARGSSAFAAYALVVLAANSTRERFAVELRRE